MSRGVSPAPRRAARGAVRLATDQRGIGLVEVLAGTLVATISVLGLAYSFGVGRGLIVGYRVSRQAMGRAELVIDSLITVPRATLAPGSEDFWGSGITPGTTSWQIDPIDDPADGIGAADLNPVDLKRITVQVSWRQDGMNQVLRLTRTILTQ